MAYTPILDTQLDPDAPITSGLGYQLRDNPLAIAAGDTGAPKIAKTTKVGSISGIGGSSTVSGLNDFGGLTLDLLMNTDGLVGTETVSISFSNNGSTFYGSTEIGSLGGDEFLYIKFVVDFGSTSYRLVRGGAGNTAQSATGTITGLSDSVTHFRITASEGTVSFMAELDGGDSSYV